MSVPITLLLLSWHLTFLCCADSTELPQDSTAPLQMEFHSVDFRNVLHWKHHPSAPEGLKYIVQYKIYGDKQWTAAELCQGIRELQCDLSQETSDPREWYYARVQSVSSEGLSPWVTSPRFNPQWDTVFSPPRIKVNVTEQGIVVHVRPPRTPLQGQKSGRISVTKLQKLTFRIYLVHNGVDEETYETDGCSNKVVIQDLTPQTTYCLQAATVTPRSGRTSARGPRTCVTTL